MGLSQFLAGWWWALLLGIGVLAGLGWRALREEPIRYAADRVILNTPMIGRLLRDLHAACSRSEEHTSELQSLMRISYAVFCLKKKKKNNTNNTHTKTTQQITNYKESKHQTSNITHHKQTKNEYN